MPREGVPNSSRVEDVPGLIRVEREDPWSSHVRRVERWRSGGIMTQWSCCPGTSRIGCGVLGVGAAASSGSSLIRCR